MPLSVLPKDFIRARQDLWFAVLAGRLESGRVLAFLRYVRHRDGGWRKTDTGDANSLLRKSAPAYLFHSRWLDTLLHGIPQHDVEEVARPPGAARHLLTLPDPDPVQRAAQSGLHLLQRGGVPRSRLGVTGSLMLGLQGPQSDVDLVVYGREHFHHARSLVGEMLASGALAPLTGEMWRDAHLRRDCSLGLAEYVQHERRKFNKFCIDGVKVDVSMVPAGGDGEPLAPERRRKIGRRMITARVVDDRYAFDLPARYPVEHDDIHEVVACTHTYVGQARAGERISASGVVEVDDCGQSRLVVGTTREAGDEFLRVLDWDS